MKIFFEHSKKWKCFLPLLPIILLSSCAVLAVPLIYGIKACEYEKNVSDDPRCNYIIGKEFSLKEDLLLYRFRDSEKYMLDNCPYKVCIKQEDGNYTYETDKINFSNFVTIKKGTCFKITQITTNASHLNGELCSQYIYAKIENQELIVDVSHLFENTFNSPSEDWRFQPKQNFILSK